MDSPQQLSITVSLVPDRARIFLTGELDLNSACALRAHFDETFGGNRADRRSLIVLDLSEITFCDAAGLHALRDLADKCCRLGATLRLVNLSSRVRRIMELTETRNHFNVQLNVEVDLRGERRADHSQRSHGWTK